MPFYIHKLFFKMLIFCSIFFGLELYGHGFGSGTPVKIFKNGWCSIEQVCLASCRNKKQKVASYNPNTHRWVGQRVKSAGQGETNCYMRIGFNDNKHHDIICTPLQEFFLSSTQQWIPAYELHKGDMLVGEHDTSVYVTYIEFVKKPMKVYSLEIKKTHNFFVGHYAVLTHNMVLPMAFNIGLSLPFGSVAAGSIGSFFGPIGLVGGIVLGSIIGLTVKAMYEDYIPKYRVPEYDMAYIQNYCHKTYYAEESDNVKLSLPGKKDTGCFTPDLETNNSQIHITSLENSLPKKEIGCIGIDIEIIDNQIAKGCGKDNALEKSNDSICFQPIEEDAHILHIQQKELVIEDVKIRYQGPKARNWKEFEKECSIGQKYGTKFVNTGRQNPKDGAPIRQLTEDIPGTEMFKKGYQFAPDRLHAGDHFEVWDRKGKWIGVANLDGSKNHEKTTAEEDPVSRNLPK